MRDKESPRETKGASRREFMREGGKQSEIFFLKRSGQGEIRKEEREERDAASLLLA